MKAKTLELQTRSLVSAWVVALLTAVGCGGAASTSPTQAAPLVPVDPCTVPLVVFRSLGSQGTANSGDATPVVLEKPARLRAVLDWTLPENDLDLYLTLEGCAFPRAGGPPTGCTVLFPTMGATKAKPEVIDTCLAPGRYLVFATNRGPNFDTWIKQIAVSQGSLAPGQGQ